MQEIKFNYIILQVRNRAPGKQRDLFQSSWIVGYKVGTRVQDALHLMMCCAVLCLVTLSCPTLCNPMDCSPPGPSVHGDSPGKNTGVGCHVLLQGIFPSQGWNPGLVDCRWILYQLSYQESPTNVALKKIQLG